MANRLMVITLVILVFGFLSASSSNAGTDMIIDNSAQAPPPPTYRYVPPVVYYAPPPPVRIVVRPSYIYHVRPARAYGYHRRVCHPWR